jgi:hypothetical protein
MGYEPACRQRQVTGLGVTGLGAVVCRLLSVVFYEIIKANHFFLGKVGKPDFLSCSLALASLSGKSTTLSYLSKDVSIRTAGTFFLFISSIVFISQI